MVKSLCHAIFSFWLYLRRGVVTYGIEAEQHLSVAVIKSCNQARESCQQIVIQLQRNSQQ